MELSSRKFYCLLLFSILFCWFFALMVAYTTLRSNSHVEIVLKGTIVGMAIWCGIGLLQRRSQVFWFAIALCIYAIFGSMVWFYYSWLLPGFYGQQLSLGFYEYLGLLYIFCGSIVIWFLSREQTRQYLGSR